ncbi:MAG TPA: AAA family ATPase [Salinivirgaceae bacterium]|nr:AAA family ATPase [Salinivirgaceae bacterium]HQA76406.1 AAA family ATPase [Salinivirgaceae bacterium]
MQRKLLEQLLAWKNNKKRLPLLLEGARQVGKTYLLKKLFGEKEFEKVVHVNFERADSELINLFEGNIEPQRIINYLSLKFNIPINQDDTLIIFDEIQEVPRALTSLKYFAEDAPEYYIAATGSLLGIALHSGTSFPVGKVCRLRLHPMDFEEFCWANNMQNQTAEARNSIQQLKRPLITSGFKDVFQQYLAIGGMPAVVSEWIENKNHSIVEIILKNILADYKDDFSKHTSNAESRRIGNLWQSVPLQFAKQNHKFFYKTIEPSARGRDYAFALDWLLDAGLIYKVNLTAHGNKLPLSFYANTTDFKIYALDVGVLRQLANLPTSFVIGDDNIWSNFGGAFAENYVLQQLRSMGFNESYYWVNNANNPNQPKGRSELDFIISDENAIYPIEVKSGKQVNAQSLRIFREKYNPKISIRFSLKDLEYNEGLLNIPLYYSFLFTELMQQKEKLPISDFAFKPKP